MGRSRSNRRSRRNGEHRGAHRLLAVQRGAQPDQAGPAGEAGAGGRCLRRPARTARGGALMSVTRRQVAASPEQVFAVLADGWLYASWVVGAARIRDVDDGWPSPGTKIHHSIGAWPVFLHDTS